MTNLVIPIAADHRGYSLKTRMMAWLAQHGYQPQDLGTDDESRCDASDFAEKFAAQFKSNAGQSGVLICGSGQAMAMTANRFAHLRAALCTNTTMARLSREHNDANVLVLGADIVGEGLALECLEVFLGTKFLGGRYAERLAKFTALGGL
jgi:ribose 5-phosphate isomerase B